jgi:hypothetical protein
MPETSTPPDAEYPMPERIREQAAAEREDSMQDAIRRTRERVIRERNQVLQEQAREWARLTRERVIREREQAAAFTAAERESMPETSTPPDYGSYVKPHAGETVSERYQRQTRNAAVFLAYAVAAALIAGFILAGIGVHELTVLAGTVTDS